MTNQPTTETSNESTKPEAPTKEETLQAKRKIRERLEAIEEELFTLIGDALDEAEERYKREGLRFDDTNEAGEGIVYPENAAPDLDLARSAVREAIDALQG